MKKLIILVLLSSVLICHSQTKIEGSILDGETKEALGYATVKILNTKYYTITNEDGKFEFTYAATINDSLEIKYLGFNTKKVPISYFKTETNLYLTPNYEALNEILITSSKNYTYDLLYKLIEKYRENDSTYESKAFLSLTSSARNIPIEHIEGFYNSKESASKGITNLDIKNGRFAQNKKFSFFSLDNTTILKDFRFFEKSDGILPSYPGNMSLGAIKSKYILKLLGCDACSDKDLSITFTSKKTDGRLFNGKIIFDQEHLIIKKIELWAVNPETKGLSSLREGDELTPKEIKLNITYNPIDYTKIQSLDFLFTNQYKSPSIFEIITSRSFLYFYDYGNLFETPYFTKKIEFRNDYDKIVALQASEEFWELNYQFPQSYNEVRSIDFLTKHGYLIHYDNSIPQDYIALVQPSVISWDKNNRLTWSSIKQHATIDFVEKDNRAIQQGEAREVDKVYNSVTEISRGNSKKEPEAFNFSYTLNPYNIDGERHVTTSTVFDRKSSIYEGLQTNNKLTYINITFDIYEYFRQNLDSELASNSTLTYDQIKEKCALKFNEATMTVRKMQSETRFGLDFQNLMNWNEKIKAKLNIDNFTLIAKTD